LKECFDGRSFELEKIFSASENNYSIAKFREICGKLGTPSLLVAKSEH
jgi:hypothetical protein